MDTVQALHTAALAALILTVRRFTQFFSRVTLDRRHLVSPGCQFKLNKPRYSVTVEAVGALTVTAWVPLHRCSPESLVLVGVVGDGLIDVHVGEV